MYDPDEYYNNLGELIQQKEKLSDCVTIDVYHDVIMNNQDKIRGKVVMNVGAGTGVLAVFCAKAGAKKVYAVEACYNLIDILKEVVRDNGCEETIEVVYGDIDSIEVSMNVDILLSEWMGQYLLHDSIINNIIDARRFLASDGLILPNKANLFIALCDLPQLTSYWSSLKDVSMEAVAGRFRKAATCIPHTETVTFESLMSLPKFFTTFNMETVSPSDLEDNRIRTVMVANRTGTVEGICLWWDVEFPNNITLSTSPFSPATRWKQTVVLFAQPLMVTTGIPVAIQLTISRCSQKVYTVLLTLLDAETEVHDVPCACLMDKCMVASAQFMESSVQIKEEPPSPPSE